MSDKQILEAKNLRKKFKKREVVKDVSIKISSGQVVGLLGPNGAGKTTSFYMIVGLIAADSGSLTFNNHIVINNRFYNYL